MAQTMSGLGVHYSFPKRTGIGKVERMSRMTNRSELLFDDRVLSASVISRRVREEAEFFLQYDYPALEGVAETTRQQFALAFARRSLAQYLPEEWDEADEPLAAILGTSYTLELDVASLTQDLIGKAESSEHWGIPVAYEEREQLWPEMQCLPSLSLAARKAFVRIMQRVDLRSQMVNLFPGCSVTDGRGLGSEFLNALAELAKAGLLDPDPLQTDLLMTCTVNELRRFAFEHGIRTRGSKHRIIKSIVGRVDPESLQTLLDLPSAEHSFLRPLIAELSLLKKFVWAETNRIELYERWIRYVQLHGHSSQPIAGPPPSSNRNRKLRQWGNPGNPLAGLSRREIRIARKLWDANCDTIVRDLAQKYAWDADCYIGQAIANYADPDKLETFKRTCEANETHVWYNLLMYFGLRRLAQMRVRIRKARVFLCPGCGDRFLESSVRPSFSKRVGHKNRFCEDCCHKILWREETDIDYKDIDEREVLSRLRMVAEGLGTVPTAEFFQHPDLSAVSEESQIVVGKALLAAPPYQAYVKAFGSWLQALILAGILEGGTQRGVFGTRCIAADGHECLSLAERMVDDWLSAHNIPHEIEPHYPQHFPLNPARAMRADWDVGGVFIEYTGLMQDPEYAARIESKRQLAAVSGIPLIIIGPEDLLSLDEKLKSLEDMRLSEGVQ